MRILAGFIGLILVYQMIIQIRFAFVWWNVPMLLIGIFFAWLYLQYRAANYKFFRYAPVIILVMIAAGIALTMQKDWLIIGIW